MQVHTCPSAISVASHCLNKILRSDKLRRKALASGMPASPPEELSNKAVDALWTAALDVVKDNFNAAEHLPKKVYDFLLPIAASNVPRPLLHCHDVCGCHACPLQWR